MARQGYPEDLLDSGELHQPGCRTNVFATMRPIVDPANGELVVVYMEWCGECGAADWEEV